MIISIVYIIGIVIAYSLLRKDMIEDRIWENKGVKLECFGLSLLSWYIILLRKIV